MSIMLIMLLLHAMLCHACVSDRATFDSYELDHPFAHGAFRWVARGSYTHGDRAGEPCVCKWFKSGAVFEATFFELDIKAVHKAVEIVKKWNAAGVINKTVRLNIPEVWQWDNGARKRAGRHLTGSGQISNGVVRTSRKEDSNVLSIHAISGSKTLVEPFIEKWQKFNSNSGWNDGEATPWSRVMQALSHFSYHATAGSCVLCDLQGGVYADGVVLTDPVILSRDRQFGVTDLGTQGISTFFSQHQVTDDVGHPPGWEVIDGGGH